MDVRSEYINLLSICSGGLGLDLGVELAIPAARTVCMVEREAYAIAQLVSVMEAGYVAPAPIWSDARTFDGRAWRGAVDGLVGGIPCQPHSLAGRKKGQHDERDLWSPARRIIVQSRPWFVVIENVGGMLSAGDDEIAGAERVYRDFYKLGFEVEAGLFTASEVGDTQERKRIFILAVASSYGAGLQGGEFGKPSGARNGQVAPGPVAEFCEVSLGRSDRVGKLQPNDSDGPIARENARAGSGGASVGLFPPPPSDAEEWCRVLQRSPHLEPSIRRMADGVATQMDELRMLGNGVVPLEAAYAVRTLGTRLAARGSSGAARLVRLMEGAQ